MYDGPACKEILALVVFRHGDIEVARNALVLLEVEISPLPVIDKLFECLLEILEYRSVSTLDLAVVYRHLGIQLLRLHVHRNEQKSG